MSEATLKKLRERMGEVHDVHATIQVLEWDQEVFMPPKGAEARGRQLATLSALAHRLFTTDEIGGLLDTLLEVSDRLDPDDAAMVRETHYDYTRATKLPEDFVERLARETSRAYEIWHKAREASDFKMFQPQLETVVDLLKQKAEYFGYEDTPYNALVEEYERGMTADQIEGLFTEIAEGQRALVAKVMAAPQPDLGWCDQVWDVDQQAAFTLDVLKDMGYDFEAGRQDPSVHPFTINFDTQDVRITTRFDEKNLFSALAGSIHEGGHALYEQGFLEKDRRTTLAAAPSLGIHESQSLLWENMVGGSLPFWEHYLPRLRQVHKGQLDKVSPQQIYTAANAVRPSFIRVDADECTYNLHIVLRFEIERAVIEGRLKVSEIPECWNATFKKYIGLDVPDNARGCLQDIHWSHGGMGYFPTYALGHLYAAQLLQQIESDLPELWCQVGAGEFGPLLGWLRKKIHHIGRRRVASQIIKDATGQEIAAKPYLDYLNKKYSALYSLN